MKRLMILVAILVSISACSNADWAATRAWGQTHHVKQFSGGVLVGEWDTDGKINETQSDGYYFEDKATGKIVSVSGTVQITVK